MANTDSIFFSANFGEQGGKFSWKSLDDVIGWINNLSNDWSWLPSVPFGATNSAWHTISVNLGEAANNLRQADSYHLLGQNAEPYFSTAKSQLESLLTNNPWLIVGSPRQLFIESLRAGQRIQEAAVLVAHWMNMDLTSVPTPVVVQALLTKELYERGIKDRVRTESAGLKKLFGEAQTTLDESRASVQEQRNHFETVAQNLLIFEQEALLQFTDAQGSREKDWSGLKEKLDADIERVKQTYKTELALAAPVDYWEKKRERHSKWTVYSGLILVCAMILAAWLLHGEIQSVGTAFEQAEAVAATVSNKESEFSLKKILQFSTTWKVGSLLLIATLAFWVLRIVVRIFLSNMHLEHDAAERVTMAKTYLALLSEGHLPPGDSINTILAALFRPTGDGFVRDEGIPPGTIDWFTKLSGRS
jgi:hypothetical protein